MKKSMTGRGKRMIQDIKRAIHELSDKLDQWIEELLY